MSNIKQFLSAISYKSVIIATLFAVIMTIILGGIIAIIIFSNLDYFQANPVLFTNSFFISNAPMIVSIIIYFLSGFVLSRMAKKNFVINITAFIIFNIFISIIVNLSLKMGSQESDWVGIMVSFLLILAIVMGGYLGFLSFKKKEKKQLKS